LHVKAMIEEFLRQRATVSSSHGEMLDGLVRLLNHCESRRTLARVS
jgi:hypothetical protein